MSFNLIFKQDKACRLIHQKLCWQEAERNVTSEQKPLYISTNVLVQKRIKKTERFFKNFYLCVMISGFINRS